MHVLQAEHIYSIKGASSKYCLYGAQCMYIRTYVCMVRSVCMAIGGTNLRRLLVGNGINVYRSITRWTNCSGKQRCGTCIVDVSTNKYELLRKCLLGVCMYVYMYVCMYVCMYRIIFVYIFVCMSVRTYVRENVCIPVCMYVHLHLCMYVCMYEDV